eukprot:Tamp_29349.p3 GENE.Tamp_29349~~Tamp_29349.p3  ORF type:complete len:112 (-),score=3.36 Tamp_29349:259-594(-)
MRLSLSILSRRALAADVLAPNVSNAIDSCLRYLPQPPPQNAIPPSNFLSNVSPTTERPVLPRSRSAATSALTFSPPCAIVLPHSASSVPHPPASRTPTATPPAPPPLHQAS